MGFLTYCAEKTCYHNNSKGRCKKFRIALNDQSMCMDYMPIIAPIMVNNSNIENNNKPIGFGG